MSDQPLLPEWVFNLNDQSQGIQRKLAEGLSARVFVGEQAMISIVNIEPNSAGSMHSHKEEQWGFLLEGECIRIQGGEEFEAKAGDFWHTPGNIIHGIRTGSSRAVVLDIFSPPREEYKKAGEGFG